MLIASILWSLILPGSGARSCSVDVIPRNGVPSQYGTPHSATGIPEARMLARSLHEEGCTVVYVNLRSGETYFLTKPLELGPEDSYTVWRTFRNPEQNNLDEPATISGGMELEASCWEPVDVHTSMLYFPDLNITEVPVYVCQLDSPVVKHLIETQGPSVIRVGQKVLKPAEHPDTSGPVDVFADEGRLSASRKTPMRKSLSILSTEYQGVSDF